MQAELPAAASWNSTRHRPRSFASTTLALGVLQALYEGGRRVPRDTALVGYDDIAYAASVAVPLTSIHRPADAMGELALRLLIAKTGAHGQPHHHQQIVLRPEPLVRSSTLAPQNHSASARAAVRSPRGGRADGGLLS
ncbi:substrate-binding domain-containing protein [Streptomyces sp. NPDC096013]|uniref:substrate-binding domain-containing protein n=1 Tax=Streptomyces sp. NPDC096013 TaxID=3366069 RepID=UPI00381F368C